MLWSFLVSQWVNNNRSDQLAALLIQVGQPANEATDSFQLAASVQWSAIYFVYEGPYFNKQMKFSSGIRAEDLMNTQGQSFLRLQVLLQIYKEIYKEVLWRLLGFDTFREAAVTY